MLKGYHTPQGYVKPEFDAEKMEVFDQVVLGAEVNRFVWLEELFFHS